MSNLQTTSAALQITEAELIEVLATSLYPGAQVNSIKMVLGYCKAAGLDPMQKPVHIVPMWDGKLKQMRDVIMPGVGLYRTQAARTGRFAGQSEPEFGPIIDGVLGGQKIQYPDWAKVTVRKQMDNGQVAEFSAIEYWTENYAIKGGQEKSTAPNAMWSKRPRGQIAKCAAAQALRLAFPEMGAQPTADEMDGKTLYEDAEPASAPKIAIEPPTWPQDSFEKRLPKWAQAIFDGKNTVDGVITFALGIGALTDSQMETIKAIPARLEQQQAATLAAQQGATE